VCARLELDDPRVLLRQLAAQPLRLPLGLRLVVRAAHLALHRLALRLDQQAAQLVERAAERPAVARLAHARRRHAVQHLEARHGGLQLLAVRLVLGELGAQLHRRLLLLLELVLQLDDLPLVRRRRPLELRHLRLQRRHRRLQRLAVERPARAARRAAAAAVRGSELRARLGQLLLQCEVVRLQLRLGLHAVDDGDVLDLLGLPREAEGGGGLVQVVRGGRARDEQCRLGVAAE
jgi:hypothetical protein